MAKANSGTAYVIYGKALGFSDTNLKNFTKSDGFKVLGVNTDGRAGVSVSDAGYINDDRINECDSEVSTC